MITLSYALLGLLARKELSGYDLSQQMKRRMSQMWSALPSQIYPELARLEAQELVKHHVVEQQDYRPARYCFRSTRSTAAGSACQAIVVSARYHDS